VFLVGDGEAVKVLHLAVKLQHLLIQKGKFDEDDDDDDDDDGGGDDGGGDDDDDDDDDNEDETVRGRAPA
jgi:hypothetical protein